jgi:hypothetical protein
VYCSAASGYDTFNVIGSWAATACTLPAAPSLGLPFTMVRSSPYCATVQNGGICTDSRCSVSHDVIRCEPCNCSFPTPLLKQHQSGRQHLQNVASNRAQPAPPSQTASTIQTTPLADISPPAGGNASTGDKDPRVDVSGEGGLEFSVEGSGTLADPLFPSTNHNISIEKTNASSCLFLQSVTPRSSLGSWCE